MLRFIVALRRWHGRIAPWLEAPRDHLPTLLFVGLLLLVIAVGVVLRAGFWLEPPGPDGTWLGQPMLTSMDGYYFAAGVGHELTGDWGADPRVPYAAQHALVAIGAGLVRVSGLQPELVYNWLPVLIGPLIAVPVALIGRALQRSVLGLAAALGTVVSPAYLARTSGGYFDTDMFVVTVPLMVALYLTRLFRDPAPAAGDAALARSRRDGFWAALWLSVYVWFYDQGLPLAMLMTTGAMLALLYVSLLHRADPPPPPASPIEAPRHAFLLAIAAVPLAWPLRTGILLGCHFVLNIVKPKMKFLIVPALVLMVVAVVTSGAVDEAARKIAAYSEKEQPALVDPGSAIEDTKPASPSDELVRWKRQDTTPSVGEVEVVPLSQLGAQSAGHWSLAFLGVLGLVLLLLWSPGLWGLLPITAIGAFALIGGQRFIIYSAPAVFMGLAYISARLTRGLGIRLRAAASGAIGVAVAIPSVAAVVPPAHHAVLAREDVTALSQLASIAGPADLTVSWWDFGYPITFYARTRNLCDGSRRADDASLAAEILLTESPARAANLARAAADADRDNRLAGAAWVLVNEAEQRRLGPAAFLAAIERGDDLRPTYDDAVYLFLPARLLPILPVIEATRPVAEGQRRGAPYLRLYQGVRSEGPTLYLADGFEVDADRVILSRTTPSGAVQERRLGEVQVISGSGASHSVKTRQGDPGAPTVGILLRDLRLFIELDRAILKRQWARLFLYEDADPRYYEPVLLTPHNKVYRFKK